MPTATPRVHIICGLVLSVALARAAAVQADTITDTQMTAALDTAGSKAPWTETLSFAQFDPALGTLNGVTVTVVDENHTTGSITSSTAQTLEFTTYPYLMVTAPDQDILFEPALSTGSLNLAPGIPQAFDLSESSSQPVGVALANLGLYTGAGTVDFKGAISLGQGNSGVMGSAVITPISTTYAEMGITVAYDYTPAAVNAVPLPPAFSTGLAGLGIFWMIRRKRGHRVWQTPRSRVF